MAMITHCRQVEMSAAEKISLQDQYPLSDGLGNGTPWKHDGGRDAGSRKNIAAGPKPPRAGEERDSGKRTMGVDDVDDS